MKHLVKIITTLIISVSIVVSTILLVRLGNDFIYVKNLEVKQNAVEACIDSGYTTTTVKESSDKTLEVRDVIWGTYERCMEDSGF